MKIAFAHNVFDRFYTLKETIDIEKYYFPDAKIFVACNSFVNSLFFDNLKDVIVKYFVETPQHKIGCVNGMMLSCNMSLNLDYDILVFTHDDVRINPDFVYIFKEKLNEVYSGKYDIVYRNPEWYGNKYAMMEAVIMNKKSVQTLFSDIKLFINENEIDAYQKTGSICPELWFYNKIISTDLIVDTIKYQEDDIRNYNKIMSAQIGFLHLNAGHRGWKDFNGV